MSKTNEALNQAQNGSPVNGTTPVDNQHVETAKPHEGSEESTNTERVVVEFVPMNIFINLSENNRLYARVLVSRADCNKERDTFYNVSFATIRRNITKKAAILFDFCRNAGVELSTINTAFEGIRLTGTFADDEDVNIFNIASVRAPKDLEETLAFILEMSKMNR